MFTTLVALSLALLGGDGARADGPAAAASRPAPAAYPVRARIWVENRRDFFRRGERLRVSFSTSADAYVAVVHIDSDGYLDFLFPTSPADDEYVRGGRVYELPGGGFSRGWTVRGRPGIGYLYILASPVPLDYRAFRGRGGQGWDWSFAGRSVRGDPFWALEQVTRTLLPDWEYVPHAADFYSYYVESRSPYPAYACGWSAPDPRAWGWSPYYDSCDRMDYLLRTHPHYFDSRLYRGDRRTVFREYESREPRHGYKESPVESGWRSPARGRTPVGAPPAGRYPDAAAPRGTRPSEGDEATPERRRPILERRPEERLPEERRPEGRAPARGVTPRGGSPAPAPAARPQGEPREAAPATPRRRRPDGGTF